jgi:hypothetical protein
MFWIVRVTSDLAIFFTVLIQRIRNSAANQTYIFNFERTPLFLSPETVAEDLLLEGAGHVNLFDAVPSLRLALTMRNLANFLRILLGPDETVQRILPQDPEMVDADHTQRLSLLFGYAWNALLRICVPRSKWTSRAAVGLLVDMATQVSARRTYTSRYSTNGPFGIAFHNGLWTMGRL